MDNVLLFVYGTLKSNYGNNRILNNAEYVGNACLDKSFSMYLTENGYFPYVVKEPSPDNVKGELYWITPDILDNTDALEGHPDFYKRQKTVVTRPDGSTIDAYIYVYPHIVDGIKIIEF